MIYLIPSFLADGASETIPPYVISAVKHCQVIFAENERTARRFLKAMDKSIVIDEYEWFAIHKAEEEQRHVFREKCGENKNIAIISEAGCPGVADPGQILVAEAQKLGVPVKPLVGPSSIILALMASGLNGQAFCFHGYLPIDNTERNRKIKSLEEKAVRDSSTHIFIETPFRNNRIIETLLQVCRESTLLCIAADITGEKEMIQTKTISQWKKAVPELHKIPVIYLIGSKK